MDGAGSIYVNGLKRDVVRTPTLRWNASFGTSVRACVDAYEREHTHALPNLSVFQGTGGLYADVHLH